MEGSRCLASSGSRENTGKTWRKQQQDADGTPRKHPESTRRIAAELPSAPSPTGRGN
jgi:hypothetical protein